MSRRVLILLGFLVGGMVGALQPMGAQVPPDESWRSLETTHFRVTFPEGMDLLARRAAARAEVAFEALSEVFLDPPGGLIELLLTDHTETSNGFATAVPYNRIVVFLRPPMEGAPLSHFDDWMELIITHELVHVFQLDHTGPIGSLFRSVLGRWEAGWPAFPNFDLPRWTTEGLATYYESSLTAAGRLRGSYIDMVLRTAVLEDNFESVDQVTGNSPNWPSGNRAYVYGAQSGTLMLSFQSANAEGNGGFGSSVAVAGNFAAVGASNENAGAGRAYYFDCVTETVLTTLVSPNPVGDGAFGCAVATVGTDVFVGACAEPRLRKSVRRRKPFYWVGSV